MQKYQPNEIEDEECISLMDGEDEEDNDGEFTIDFEESEGTNSGNTQSSSRQSSSSPYAVQGDFSDNGSEIQGAFSDNESEIQGAFSDTNSTPTSSSSETVSSNTPDTYYKMLLTKITSLEDVDIRNLHLTSTTELAGFIGILDYNYVKYVILFASEEHQYYNQLIEEFLSYKSTLLEDKHGKLNMLDIQKCLNLDDVYVFINLPISELQDVLTCEGFLYIDGVYTKCLG